MRCWVATSFGGCSAARYGVYRVPITLLNTNAFSTYAEGHA
jgi:hypothetical protein